MKHIVKIARNSLWILCALFLMKGCATETGKAEPVTHIVEIKQMKFQPAELTVQKGDTVVWINNDIVAHDVTEEPGKAWTSSVIPVGKSWSLVATESADYICTIHVVMNGKLIVK